MLATCFTLIVPVTLTMIHAVVVRAVWFFPDVLHKPFVSKMATVPDGLTLKDLPVFIRWGVNAEQ